MTGMKGKGMRVKIKFHTLTEIIDISNLFYNSAFSRFIPILAFLWLVLFFGFRFWFDVRDHRSLFLFLLEWICISTFDIMLQFVLWWILWTLVKPTCFSFSLAFLSYDLFIVLLQKIDFLFLSFFSHARSLYFLPSYYKLTFNSCGCIRTFLIKLRLKFVLTNRLSITKSD